MTLTNRTRASLRTATIALVLLASTALNAQQRPLLLEGFDTVYQRVLTRPGATIRTTPDAADGEVAPPFTPLYVFAREGSAVQVGPSPSEGPAGWLDVGKAVDWDHNIVASFTVPNGRNRQVMFEDVAALRDLINHESVAQMQAELLSRADSGTLTPADRVVTVEPELPVDLDEAFYILPILSYEEDFNPQNYRPMLLMELASLPLEEAQTPDTATRDFDAGIIFVMDTTQSMEPYIRSTRDAVAEIMQGMSDPTVGANIHYGVVGFRDDPQAAPGLEYRTRTFAPLIRRDDAAQVLSALDAMDVATVSSPGFNEDAFAGIEDALSVDWAPDGQPFGGRYIVLITDAGPKGPNDPNARTAIGAQELRTLASESGAAVLVVHLLTNAGTASHDYAATAYRALAQQESGILYYPVEGGDPAAFAQMIEVLVRNLTDQVRTAAGLGAELPDDAMDPVLADVGNAMRLRWLGRQQGSTAPDVLRFWASDIAVDNPNRLALMPRLLVTRNELSTMASLLSDIVTLAEETQEENAPEDLFRQVRGVVSRMARSPDLAVNAQFTTLGEAFGELLTGLPYQSQIMSMTEDRWIASAAERRAIIDQLKSRLSYYRRIHNEREWIALHDGAPDGEHVYAIPFSTLP